MTPAQIALLAATGEFDTREFEETTGTRREAAKTVCALLNQRGGQAFFRITQEREVVGQLLSERAFARS